MGRPRVVMSVGASVDGKVALSRENILMHEPTGSLYRSMNPPPADPMPYDVLEAMRQLNGCNAILEGSGSLVQEGTVPEPLPTYDSDPDPPYTNFLPPEIVERPSPPRMWFTLVDSRGRVRWREDHEDWDVLVLVSHSTPPDYLAYLRRLPVCYLVAGDERVDLPAAITAMGDELNIGCLLSTAGGGLNGALHRAGLIDELFLTLSPGLIGGLGTPSILDGTPLAAGDRPTPLRLLSVAADVSGVVRLHYEVQRATS